MSEPWQPDETVVRSGGRVVPRRTIGERGARAALWLRDAGVNAERAVAVLLRNDIAFFEVAVAARLAGATMVPVNWHFHPREVAYILADCRARVLIAHADLLPALRPHLPDDLVVVTVATPPEIAAALGLDPVRCAAAPGDQSFAAWCDDRPDREASAMPGSGTVMLYTSGTTGRPKGVRRRPLDDAQQAAYFDVLADGFGIRPGMRTVMTGPMYHSAPFAYANVSAALGADIALMPRFDAEALLRQIEAERITHLHLVPTMFVRLLKLPEASRARHDVGSLECVAHGAAPCPREVKAAMIDWWGPVFREYYGSTEASLISIASSEDWLSRPGTVGRPHRHATVEIVDEGGRVVGADTVGEIYARLDPAPQFTYNNRDRERSEIDREGLVTNGDLGYFDADGYLYLCDRKRDMVISGGVNIYPAEIEGVLINHPRVRDCAVFGVPDAEFGERLAAAIEVEPGESPSAVELDAYLREHLASFKVPRQFEFHATLPREDNGKIYKRRLREPHWPADGSRI